MTNFTQDLNKVITGLNRLIELSSNMQCAGASSMRYKILSIGDTVEDMMNYVHLDANLFKETYATLVNTKLPEAERIDVYNELVAGLNGYTYLEDF